MATKEIVDFVIKADDSQFQAALNNSIGKMEKANAEVVKLGQTATKQFEEIAQGASDAITNASGEAKDAAIENLEAQKKLGKETKESAKQTSLWARALVYIRQQLGLGQTKLESWISGLRGLSQRLKESRESTQQAAQETGRMSKESDQGAKKTSLYGKVLAVFSGAAQKAGVAASFLGKMIKLALIGTGIGAILVLIGALGALAAASARASNSLSAVQVAIIGIQAAATVGKNRLREFGKGLEDVLSGNTRQGVQRMGSAFSDLAVDIAATTAQMVILAQETQRLNAGLSALEQRTAATQDKVNALRETFDDETKSTGARISALKKAGDIQAGLEDRRLELAKKALEIAQTEYRLREGDAKAQEDIANAFIEYKEAEAEVNQRRRADARQINDLLTQQREKVKALRDEYKKFLDDLGQRVQAAELSILPDIERIAREKEIAEKEILGFRKDIEKAFSDLSKVDPKIKLPENFGAQFDLLFKAAQEEFEKAVDEYKKQSAKESPFSELFELTGDDLNRAVREIVLPTPIFAQLGDELEDEITNSLNRAKDAADRFTIDLKNKKSPFQEWKESLLESLRISDEEANLIFDSLGLAISSFAQSQQELANAQLDYLQRVIDAYDEQISALENKLDAERKLQEQGYANNVTLYEQQLKDIQKKRDEAEEKALQQQRKIARTQLVINAAQQVSEYTLAIVRLLSSGAKTGVIGLVAAIGGIALVARLVAQAKATALQNAEPPKFRFGGSVLDRGMISGPSHGFGGRKIEVEGREFVVRREYAEKNLPILEAINSGMLDFSRQTPQQILSLAPLLSQIRNTREKKERLDLNMSAYNGPDYHAAIRDVARQVIEYMETRPVRKIDRDGTEVISWKEGKNKITQKIKKQP